MGRLRLFKNAGSTGHDRGSWSVFLLLVVVVLVPTAVVLWFMSRAMENEHLVARERLEEAYTARLDLMTAEIDEYWSMRAAEVDSRLGGTAESPETFAGIVRAGLADSAVVLDENGRPQYPADLARRGAEPITEPPRWAAALRLERRQSYGEAAARYDAIASASSDPGWVARALQARARCLVRDGDRDAAVRVLTEDLLEERFRGVADPQGRLLVPNGLLLALDLLDDPQSPASARIAGELSERLASYVAPTMPSAQRRFLMRELTTRMPDAVLPDTRAAEDLAARFLEAGAPGSTPGRMSFEPQSKLWQLRSASGRVVALYEAGTIEARLRDLLRQQTLPEDTRLVLIGPDSDQDPDNLFVATSIPSLTNWSVGIELEAGSAFEAAADRRVAGYRLAALFGIAIVLALGALIARTIARQMRLTRLKNDLLATVSHELKTPLASMRLLVDTLLDGERHSEQRVHDYLELISKENARLSRLVENFLTFSRMERNKQAYERQPITPAELVHEAADAIGERFRSAGVCFEIAVDDDLPAVVADRDAMVTVLLNLLDNAFKYSGDDKRIALRAQASGDEVRFAVEDNGIGFSARAARRIFDRFFQVDQSLSRSGSGTGLGLSIVRFIVQAHGGRVDVASRPGQGSTFTVRLPATARRAESSRRVAL